jgi:hypothetical protein
MNKRNDFRVNPERRFPTRPDAMGLERAGSETGAPMCFTAALNSSGRVAQSATRRAWKPVLAGLLWLGLGAVPAWSAPAFSVTLDRNVVPVGETVTLNMIFEGATPAAAPPLPALPNLRAGGAVGQSTELSFVNGQQTSKHTYTYTLLTTQVGDIVIPSIQVQVGGRTLVSQPVQLKVIGANARPANPDDALANLAFIRLAVEKTEVYVGEPFPVDIQLYVQAGEGLQMPQITAAGFSLGQIPQPAQTRTVVNGVQYTLLAFKLTATAARTGALTFGPVQESLTLLIPIPGQRSFFGPQYQRRPVTLSSEAVAMRVLPLPTQNVPEDFNGAIGNYQLSVTAGPTNLGVGDPITVRVQISGRGPIESLTLPAQPQWRDFNTYPATAKVETSDPLGLAGVKKFEQVIIPLNHEIKSLPPLRFSFFDPNAKAYRTLSGRAIPLAVRPSGVAASPLPSLTNASSGAAQPPADDILHIKPRMELPGAAVPLLASQPWFLVLQGVPALAWLALLAWRKRGESLANNPRLRRQRDVAQRVRDGLKELRAQAGAQQSDAFFATLFRLLQEQLGERLDLPASAITEAVIDERLRGRGLPDHALKSLHELFQTCNLARYAPLKSGQELAALIPKMEDVLHALQQIEA